MDLYNRHQFLPFECKNRDFSSVKWIRVGACAQKTFSFAFRFFCTILRVCKLNKRDGILTCQVDVF